MFVMLEVGYVIIELCNELQGICLEVLDLLLVFVYVVLNCLCEVILVLFVQFLVVILLVVLFVNDVIIVEVQVVIGLYYCECSECYCLQCILSYLYFICIVLFDE